jgi:hypothetical protein
MYQTRELTSMQEVQASTTEHISMLERFKQDQGMEWRI